MKLRAIVSQKEWQQIKKLYRTAFPKYERKPLWIVKKKNRKGQADVWLIEEDGAFAGFAIMMNQENLVLLDYFAIADEMRTKGLGKAALRALQEHYRGKKFFLEIESVSVPCDNLAERQRRKNFYLNNGMEEMHIMVDLFGTQMEVLGYECDLDFAEYQSIYRLSYGKWVAKNVKSKN